MNSSQRAAVRPAHPLPDPYSGQDKEPGGGAEEFDYIVVGSGAGGGPLAARLAEAGMNVLLLEAGSDEDSVNYQVPGFHAAATEDKVQRWDYFVRHYADRGQQAKDEKFLPDRDGVLYPRAGTLGGCTAHNAMITVCPHNSDWDRLAELTGDTSWHSRRMQRYFHRLERCTYITKPWPVPDWLDWLRHIPLISDRLVNRSRHGFKGWLGTHVASPALALGDGQLLKIILSAAESSLGDFLKRPLAPLEGLNGFFDPNDWRARKRNSQGVWFVPLATTGGRRNGSRERIQAVAEKLPRYLQVRTNTLVTKVLLDQSNRAVGVEYIDSKNAYRADPRATQDRPLPAPRQVHARREVILAAGAFNTPQLLMLSGIGPADELKRHGLPVRVDLPGVGQGLQDRYEVGVVSEMNEEFPILRGKSFTAPVPGTDPEQTFQEWQAGKGLYTSNGVVLGITAKSKPERPEPDLFIFGLPIKFTGYYPGYSRVLEGPRNFFTWAILKSHTNNTAGDVRLRSSDPRDPPEINFRYFDEGNDDGEDLDAVVTGIEFARSIMKKAGAFIRREAAPGEPVQSREDLREFVRNQAWGHHASCTCRMGKPEDPLSVVNSRFQVRGVANLRIVDASIFRSIPGFFIAAAIYMAAEKAADAILADVALHTRLSHRMGRISAAGLIRRGVRPGL